MAKAGEMFNLPADDPFYDEEVTGMDKPIGDIPVSDAVGKAPVEEKVESYLDTNKPAASESEGAQVVEDKKEEEAPAEGLALTDDTLILDDRDGKVKPWSEIKGLAVLKKESDAEKFAIGRERAEIENIKRYIDANKPFVDAIAASDFGVTLATSLRNGIPEDQAIAAAFAASGKASPLVPSQQKVDEDPEPQIPDNFNENDPQHMVLAQKHMQWEQRKLARNYAESAVGPLRAELNALKQERESQLVESARRVEETKAIVEHNRKMLGEVPKFVNFNPDELASEDQTSFWHKFDEAGAKLGIPIENHKLSLAEVRGIMAEVAPGGVNPFLQRQQQPVRKTIDKPAPLQHKQPLQPGTPGGSQSGGTSYLSETDRVRDILEGMSTGKPVEGVPVF